MRSILQANWPVAVSMFVALLLLSLASVSFPAHAHAATNGMTFQTHITEDGYVDEGKYCKFLGYKGASLDGKTAYDWHCVTQSGRHVGFSMTAACRWQYKDPQAIDVILDFFTPSSWFCDSNARDLGGINLNGYCQAGGYTGVSLDGKTAYDWRCVSQSGQHVGIDMSHACYWQYNNVSIVARMANYYNPSSWQCWG